MLTHQIETEEIGSTPVSWAEKSKLAFSLLLLVCLLSQGKLDPTPLNAVMPEQGVTNWLGLTGSLTAGVFLDFWGNSSFLIPLVLLFLVKKEPKGWIGDTFFLFMALCNLSIFLSLSLPLFANELQNYVGLFGMAAKANLIGSPLFWPALGVSFAFVMRTGLAFRLNSNLFSLVIEQLKSTKGVTTLFTHGLQPILQQVMILFSPIVEIFFNLKNKAPKQKPTANNQNVRQEELMQDAFQAYQKKNNPQ